MARKRVLDLNVDNVYGFGEKKGDKRVNEEVSGYYLGSKNVQGSMGPSIIHAFQTAKGSFGVWGSKQLNDNLAQVIKGTMTFITYKGKVKIPRGTMKTFLVEFDDEDTIPLANVDVNFTPSNSEADAEDAIDDSVEASDYDDAEQELAAAEEEIEEVAPPVQTRRPQPASSGIGATRSASTATADQRAKAQALLSKKR